MQNPIAKDPYLRPVLLSGLLIALLSVIFSPGLFLWAIVGGYIAVKLASRVTKDQVSLKDALLIGLFAGMLGGASFDIFLVASFNSPEMQGFLIRALQKNWPSNITPIPDFKEILPSVFSLTSVFVIIISIVFSFIGAAIGFFVAKKRIKKKID